MPNEDLIYKIKPKYNIIYTAISRFWDIFVFGLVLVLIGSQPNMLFYAIITGIVITIFVLTYVVLKNKRSLGWSYKFYSDRLVCNTSFIRKRIKEIEYTSIKEIRYSQSFLQSKFNIGDIYIQTKDGNVLKRINVLQFVPNVEKEYQKIVELLNS